MVRIKHRYLLVNFLSPALPPSSSSSSKPSTSASTHETLHPTIHFHAPLPSSLTTQLLHRALRAQIADLFGDYGVGVIVGGLSVKYLSPATATAIIRCPRDHFRMLWAALTFLTELPVGAGGNNNNNSGSSKQSAGGREVVCRVVRVSGTIRKCEEEAVRRARRMVLRVRREEGGVLEGIFGGEGEDDGVGDVMDVDDEGGGFGDEEETSDEEE